MLSQGTWGHWLRHLNRGAWVRGEGRWLRTPVMKGQNHRGIKRLVSAQKMKSCFLWRGSLVLRFKCISHIPCVHFHFNFAPSGTVFPLHYFSSPGVAQNSGPQTFLSLNNHILKEVFLLLLVLWALGSWVRQRKNSEPKTLMQEEVHWVCKAKVHSKRRCEWAA